MPKTITRDYNGFERIVFGEVIIPGTLNTWGDFHTAEAVREFAYTFMVHGFGIDTQHDEQDVGDKVKVIESFIARPGDPDFTEGSWVLGMMVFDDTIWQEILDGEINGYSWQGLARLLPIEVEVIDDHLIYGVTEPDAFDGHSHSFFVILDGDGRVVAGGTTGGADHEHTISQHTYTDKSLGHRHIFNVADFGG